MSKHQGRLSESKLLADKGAADAATAGAAAEKLEQEAAAIEQRLASSQKAEIIVQLQRQNNETQASLDAATKNNVKIEEKLRFVLARLGEDASAI